jgi:hypothetical protein
MGLILGPEEDPVREALEEMNARLRRIEDLVAGLYEELERVKEQIIKEIRSKNWDRLIAELKPWLAYIDEKYETLMDLAKREITEDSRREARRLVEDILSHNAGGVRPSMKIINELMLDSGGAMGLLHSWEEIVHDAAFDWIKVEAPKLEENRFAAEEIERFHHHMRSLCAEQTMNLFAWIAGVQLKGLILLMEAAHAKPSTGACAGRGDAPDHLVERYRGYIRESGNLFTDVMESIVAHLPLVSSVNYAIDDGAARQVLDAADRLVTGALGVGRIVVHLRCDLEHYGHAQAKKVDRYLHDQSELALRLSDGRSEYEATNGRTGTINRCPAKPFIESDKWPIRFRFYRRYVFEGIEPGYYQLVDINAEAPRLNASGTTLAMTHGDDLLHPDFFQWGRRIYCGGPWDGSLHLVAYQNNTNERSGTMTLKSETVYFGKGLVIETVDFMEWLLKTFAESSASSTG